MTERTVERAARNEVLFREVNEQITSLSKTFIDDGVKLFVCECGDETCAEALEVTLDEYEAVRASGARFLIAPGHEINEIERIVERTGRFFVVEKLGEAQRVAIEGDPRAAARGPSSC